jgi:DNA (cytosine-5)-methyltransferase 1
MSSGIDWRYEFVEQNPVGHNIWIHSAYCETKGSIWYRLGTPEQYHHLFVLVANLAEHFVDYLHEHQAVTLNHFKRKFSPWP